MAKFPRINSDVAFAAAAVAGFVVTVIGAVVLVSEMNDTQHALCDSSYALIGAVDNQTTILASPLAFNVDDSHPAVIELRANTATARADLAGYCPTPPTTEKP